MARHCVRHHITHARAEFNMEIEVNQLACALVLGDHRGPLVEQKFEAEVVNSGDERPSPQIWLPVANCLDQADELAFVSRELGVLRR
jgi:hypothetical protein